MTDYAAFIDQLAGNKDARHRAWEELTNAKVAAIPTLIEGLHQHSNVSVRIDCVLLLAKLDDPRIDPAFLHAMQHDHEWRVRGHCVKAIGNIEDDEVMAAAVEMLLYGNVPAADRLRHPPQSHKALAILNQRLDAATTPEERQPFMKALMRLSSAQSYPQYLDWLTHANPDYRLQAAEALERHAYNAPQELRQVAYERLLERLPVEPELVVQVRMVKSLGYMRRVFDERAFWLLTEYLQHPQAELAETARRALGAAGYDPANRHVLCAVCGKKQPERKVELCHICGKSVCADHWVQDPLGHHAFCSEQHEQEFTKAQGINYWK